MVNFSGWLRQPSTITGIGALVGLAAATIADFLTGSATADTAVGAIVFGVMHLFVNDNSALPADTRALVADVMKAELTGTLKETLPTLIQDGFKVATDLSKPAEVAPVPIGASSVSRGLGGAGLAIALIAFITLPACTKEDLKTACLVDGALIPVTNAILLQTAPSTARAVAIDQTLVHPAVVKFCEGLGGVPVVTPAPPAADLVAKTAG